MIAYVTYEEYPDGSPGAIRGKSFVDTLRSIGKDTIVLHRGEMSSNEHPKIISLFSRNRWNKFLFYSCRVIYQLEKLRKSDNLEAVIIYSSGTIVGLWLILHWCYFFKIPVIKDVVEWYSKEQFKYGVFSFNYILKNIENRYIIDENVRVIAISSYLYNYYKGKGCKTTQIPIIKNIDRKDIQQNLDDNRPCSFIYAGSHLKMDNIPLVLFAFASLSDNVLKKVRFDIYGLSQESIEDVVGKDLLSKLSGSVFIHGRVPNSEVIENYKTTDFCLLFRNPELRVNKAGFPSKVIESMSMGVTIFGNYSSDLSEFLRDGENSIIVSELNVSEIAHKIADVAKMSREMINTLKINAFNTVKDNFSELNFQNNFLEILNP